MRKIAIIATSVLSESEESLHERIKILERSLIVATIGPLLAAMEKNSL